MLKKFNTLAGAFALAACALLATLLLAPVATATFIARDTMAEVVRMNERVADFSLPDADGKAHKLSTLRGAKGTAIIFISVQCPVSNGYNARMAQIAADYKARGINVIGINSNVAETPDQIKAHAGEKNLSFPILKDKGNKIADRFNAQFTPEVFLLDSSDKLVYHGRIDNSRSGDSITASDLRNAMDALLSNQPVPVAETKAFGCSIKRAA